jgi:hypothetical protein
MTPVEILLPLALRISTKWRKLTHPGGRALKIRIPETTYTPGTERDARAQNLQGLRETYGGQSQSGPSFSEGMRDTNANIR